eukprot:COSAG01_NODE_218_length_21548_cov_7.916919_1_plen_94_part_00
MITHATISGPNFRRRLTVSTREWLHSSRIENYCPILYEPAWMLTARLRPTALYFVRFAVPIVSLPGGSTTLRRPRRLNSSDWSARIRLFLTFL